MLITGAAGQVGRALAETVPEGVEADLLTRDQLDIADERAVSSVISARRPDVVINAAAYTAVDLAEREPEAAEAINALGPLYIAQAAQKLPGCRVLHISTDYVFNGRSDRPYTETDPTDPVNAYGRTKLQGEQAVLRALGDRCGILRTSWVYAPYGRNFLLTMLRLMRAKGEVRVVADQVGCPTAAQSVACALWRWVERGAVAGILHWTDEGKVSWYEFACRIASFAVDMKLLQVMPTVVAIGTSDYPTPAKRPARSVMDSSRAERLLELRRWSWEEGLVKTMSRLAEGADAPE